MSDNPVTPDAAEALFEGLLEDWDYGDCPGSKLKVGNQEVWLYTREDVRQWLRARQRAWRSGEAS